MDDKRLRVISDGTPVGTLVLNEGRPVKGLREVTVHISADQTVARATAVFAPAPVKFRGEVVFAMCHPETGTQQAVKAIDFADGSRWEAECNA